MKKFTDFKIEKKPILIKEDNEINDIETPDKVKTDVSKFVSKMFESREMAHIYHLQTKEYSTHKALDNYYNDILELIDQLIETYQGQYDIIEDYDIIDSEQTHTKDTIEYFIELSGFIKENRKKSFSEEDTHLQNIIDEMVALIYRTLYKLRFLK